MVQILSLKLFKLPLGAETNYYIEVSGENVYEGMIIRASAVETEAETEVNSGFSLSDLFGGNSGSDTQSETNGQMPSGGDMPTNNGGNAGGVQPE